MKVALTRDWRDDDDPGPTEADLAMLKGLVERAEYRAGNDVLTLTYAGGRQVTVTLHQCRTHSCDETLMVLEGEVGPGPVWVRKDEVEG